MARDAEWQKALRATDEALDDLTQKLEALAMRVEQLEHRPRAGRPPLRLNEASSWLEKLLTKGPCRVSFVLRKGAKEGYSAALLRRAATHIEVVKDTATRRWSLARHAASEEGDDD